MSVFGKSAHGAALPAIFETLLAAKRGTLAPSFLMKKVLLAALPLCLLLSAACNKGEKDFKSAVVRNSGDVSAGGCGYLLDVEDEGERRPDYLPSAFQHDGMRVDVKFTLTGVVDTCGNRLPYSFHEIIRIDDIRRADD